jgi:hypothetical protein
MLRRALVIATAVVLVASACSGGDDSDAAKTTMAPQTTPPAAATTQTTVGSESTSPIPTTANDRVGCRVKITGAINTEFTGKDDSAAFNSDYYFTQQQIDDLTHVPSDDTDTLPTDTTVAGEEGDIPPRPAGAAPVFSWFLLNCQGGDTTLNLYANVNATKEDVPFGPGRYDIAGQGGSDDPKVFSATVAFGAEPGPEMYDVSPGGHVQIDRFDTKGAKGSFEFSMQDATGQKVDIDGTFDVTCHTDVPGASGDLCAATG